MTAEELDDVRAYLSDFFIAFRDAALAEQEMEETFLRYPTQPASWQSNWRRGYD